MGASAATRAFTNRTDGPPHRRTAGGSVLSLARVSSGFGFHFWEHPTSKIEHPMASALGIHWMLDVRCWLLDVFHKQQRPLEFSSGLCDLAIFKCAAWRSR